MVDHYKLQIAETEAERQRIYSFRYQIYVGEMQKAFSGADHVKQIFRDELDDSGILFYISEGEELICSTRVNLVADIPDSHNLTDWFRFNTFSVLSHKEMSFSSRLMVAKSWRRTLILGKFLNAVYRYCRNLGIKLDFCYCAPSLVHLYEYLGYRQYSDNFTDFEVGYRVPLLLVSEDLKHLQAVHSPFFMAARKYKLPTGSRDLISWIEKKFPRFTQTWPRRLINPDEHWAYMSERLHSEDVPLLNGFTPEEVSMLLNDSPAIPFHKGEGLVTSGEVGKELFVILSGAVEVRKVISGQEYGLLTLGKGDIFGEMAFVSAAPRSADVFGLTEGEMLVLTPDYFQGLMRRLPDISAKMLLNLSMVLCERLRLTTRQWANLTKKQEEAGDG